MLNIESITFACTEPDELATFWETALEGTRHELSASIDPEIVHLDGDGPDLLFREAPKGTDRDLPIHLDFSADDRAAAIDRLTDLGATVRETKTEAHEDVTYTWTVLEDPEGNGFCVSAPAPTARVSVPSPRRAPPPATRTLGRIQRFRTDSRR